MLLITFWSILALFKGFGKSKMSVGVKKAHLHPKGLARGACCLWISCNTKLFLSGFLSKSVSSGVILTKIVQKLTGIYSSIVRLLFLELFCACAGQMYFFRSYFVQYVSRQMILRSRRYCTVIPKENIVSILRGEYWLLSLLTTEENTEYWVSEELVLWSKETEIWWISCSDVVWIPDCFRCGTLASKFDSFDLIFFFLHDVNRTARECIINEWFCRTVFFFCLCVYRRKTELK